LMDKCILIDISAVVQYANIFGLSQWRKSSFTLVKGSITLQQKRSNTIT